MHTSYPEDFCSCPLLHGRRICMPSMIKTRACQKTRSSSKHACRIITGCLRLTNINNLYLLAGIASPETRRETASREERLRQITDPKHSLYEVEPETARLKQERCFLTHVKPLVKSKSMTKIEQWTEHLQTNPISVQIGVEPPESLPLGNNAPRPRRRALNRLRSGVDCTKANLIKWGDKTRDSTCCCGTEAQNKRTSTEMPDACEAVF